ncbi:hypothetical protein HCU74_07205 [Spongiibacter sp. KMU-166]|uniref:Preprotein translocase subunit YajC n=1 Tax=Spongiibacter thalassae TaxID=2721624 RepID=A0ABX1GFJ2_9GAMM|nr:hypothetical protein [Spongiibacter thalassae]NKI17208.1 hypothetical protein [Spongiibacter thalassae]
MFWLIVIGVLAFMLAPILWIIPSPRQKRQIALRDVARKQGILVQIGSLPQSRRQRVRKEGQIPGLAYCLMLPKGARLARWRLWFNGEGEHDDVAGPPDSVRQKIAALGDAWPEDVILIEASEQMLKVYWREKNADVATVEALVSAMTSIVEEIGPSNEVE